MPLQQLSLLPAIIIITIATITQTHIFVPKMPPELLQHEAGQLLLQESNMSVTYLSQHPQSFCTQPVFVSSLFINKRMTRIINHKIVPVSPPQFFPPNKLNISLPPFSQLQSLLPSQQPNKSRNTRIKKSIPSFEPKRLPQHLLPSI